MKIVRLQSENIKGVTAVEIKPDGSLIVIAGKNGAGKSSVLDSIMYALAGTKTIPAMPIRRGQSKAKVCLDLGEYTVERTFTEGNSRLTVKSKDGASFPSPQAMLDKLCGNMSFDPLAFLKMKPAEQLATIKGLVGLDFTDLDNKRRGLYEQRTDINRDAKRVESQLLAVAVDESAPAAEVSVSDLAERLQEVNEANKANESKRASLRTAGHSETRFNAEHNRIVREIAELQAALVDVDFDLANAQRETANLKAEVESLADGDTAPIRARMAGAEETNRKVRANKQAAALRESLAELTADADGLTEEIEAIDRNKAMQVTAAKFPVEGLGFADGGVTYDGLPFEQVNKAVQVRVSVSVGFAQHPTLNVVLVREGNDVDVEELEVIAQVAEDHDGQCFLERRLGNDGPVSVIIEDGHVKAEVDQAEAATA